MKYRKKPVVIDAVLWDGKDLQVIADFVGNARELRTDHVGRIIINTLEGDMTASTGDWIIRGVKGEYYPCKPDIFAATYEKVDE